MDRKLLMDDLRAVFERHNVSHLQAQEEGAALYMQGNTLRISGSFVIEEKHKLNVVEGGERVDGMEM